MHLRCNGDGASVINQKRGARHRAENADCRPRGDLRGGCNVYTVNAILCYRPGAYLHLQRDMDVAPRRENRICMCLQRTDTPEERDREERERGGAPIA